LVKG
jgi:pimeloyl-ACP methyl ester carboxylesterase